MLSLYVTVTADCEDLANAIFGRWGEWQFDDEEYQDDGNIVLAYSWNGDMRDEVERNLDMHRHVISYQII